jgi:DNA transformation protein
MPVQPQYLAFILEQLCGLPAVRPNRMFGGIGLYSDGIFFGLIDDDTLFFKTGPANVADYLSRNMPKFMPFPDKTGAVMGYHQVPADVIEDPELLADWARKSVSVALSSRAAKAAKPKTKAATRKKNASTPGKSATRKRSGKSPRKPARKVARSKARKKQRSR